MQTDDNSAAPRPQPKDGRLPSKAFIDWARRQPCRACWERDRSAQGPSEAHHYPPKGSGGATHRDDHVIPLCRRHHDMAQQYKIPKSVQRWWVHETRSRFIEYATPAEIEAYVLDLLAWKRRPFAEGVPT